MSRLKLSPYNFVNKIGIVLSKDGNDIQIDNCQCWLD